MDTKANKQVVMLDPSRVLADHNYRHSLIKSKVNAMMEAIVADGGITSPVEVEPLTGDPDHDYLLVTGHYRLAGLRAANAGGAGLLLPAFELPSLSALDRLKRQLSENMERENNSPIDEARAMKAMLEAGASRMDVRTRFKRRGSPKPASNSFVNMTVSFLELPRKIQTKIHEGTVGVGAAYELMKAYKVAILKQMDPIATVNRIVEQAEAATAKRMELDDQEEEKFLEAERKAEEARVQHELAIEAQAAKELEAQNATQAVEAARKQASALYAAKSKAKDAESKKLAEEQFRAAEKLAQDAERAQSIKQKELDKAKAAADKIAAAVATQSQRLSEARAAAPKKGQTASNVAAGAIKRAASDAGATDGAVPLNGSQFATVINNLALPGSFPIVSEIGKALKSCREGHTTEAQLLTALAIITGEKTAPAPKAKKSSTKAA